MGKKNSRKTKIIMAALAVALIVGGIAANANLNSKPAHASAKGIVGSDTELRGVWVPTVHNLAYPSKIDLSITQLKKEADDILDNSKDLGFNVIFFQVRPSADALYKSDIYPWSRLITGNQGVAPSGGFDPLQYFIDGAHARDMELHAWVNPYRITTGEWEKDFLSEESPALIYPELTVDHSDGKMYFNPGEPDARKLVVDGIAEIVDKYDVDGIHFDDYFYPDESFADEATFAEFGAEYKNVGEFRRANNDKLVQEVKEMLDGKGKNTAFGISPFGIWANSKNNSLGSDTGGNESYYGHYADTRKWVKEGYIDYIMPQIYWEMGHQSADYLTLAKWWSEVVNDTNVKLYIGMAPYKAIDVAADSPWAEGKEITMQLEYNKTDENIKGNSMYAYQSIMKSDVLYKVIKNGYGSNSDELTPPIAPVNPSTPPIGETVNAVVTDIKVTIDGTIVNVGTYNVDGNNYFKLRDVAFALSNSDKKFEVTWDEEKQAINMKEGTEYTPVGGEMFVDLNAKDSQGTVSTAKIYLEGTEIQLNAYNIAYNNYFKLRDLGQTFDFATDWDNDTRTIHIKTNESYNAQ